MLRRKKKLRKPVLDGTETCTLAHHESTESHEIWRVVRGNLYLPGTLLTSDSGMPENGQMAVWLVLPEAVLLHRRGDAYFTTAGVRMHAIDRAVIFRVILIDPPA